MPVSFGASVSGDQAELCRFLSETFGITEESPAFTADAMAWKYFDKHPWWPDGRSYVLRNPEGIAAHACVSPVRFAYNGDMVDSMYIVDWAAGRQIPGAGLLIFRRCFETGRGTLVAIGGSEETRRIIPQLKWFTRKDDILHYARPLRPWRHFARSAKGPRDVARFARNLSWWIPPLPRAGSWLCRAARPGEEVFSHSGSFVPILRTRAWFDYLLRCPLVKTELVILETGGKPCGHAFLANAGGSMRVGDFVVAGEVSPGERTAAFSALMRYIAAQPDVAEMVAASSLREMCGVFEKCGMHSRGASPVHLADPRKLIPDDARLEITPLIGDAFYWFDPARPFIC